MRRREIEVETGYYEPEHPMLVAARSLLPRPLAGFPGVMVSHEPMRAPWPLKKEWLKVQRWADNLTLAL